MPKHNVKDADLEELNKFENEYNKYIRRFGIQNNRLYAGTFDIGTGTADLSFLNEPEKISDLNL